MVHTSMGGRSVCRSIFISATLTVQEEGALTKFELGVLWGDEVLECHLMAGGTDYLIRVADIDFADFERIHRDKLA